MTILTKKILTCTCKDIKNNSRVVVVHAFNPSILKAEIDRSLWVRSQPSLQELVPGQAPKLPKKPALKNKDKKNKERKEKEKKNCLRNLS